MSAGTGGDVVLGAAGLVRRFGDTTAVDGFTMELRRGEVVGLLGANGAGKTTALRMVLGLLVPSSGSVTHFGAAPTRESRTRFGYVPQTLGLWPTLTVSENLGFVEEAYGGDAAAARDVLAGVPDRPVGMLPLGEQRRVAFAAAFAHQPDVLVLDEPTSGVGPLARTRLWDDVHSAVDAGTAVLVTTHYMDEAVHCDRLVVLAGGRSVAEGTVDAIVAGAKTVVVRGDSWARTFAALDAAGLPVSLVGTTSRVLGDDAAAVQSALTRAGVDADLETVPASFDEVFVALARDRAS